jgi:hypothetical protein
MDRNIELLMAKSGEPRRWEDEEKASYNIDLLEAEFRKRLYARDEDRRAEQPTNGSERKPE